MMNEPAMKAVNIVENAVLPTLGHQADEAGGEDEPDPITCAAPAVAVLQPDSPPAYTGRPSAPATT